MNEKLMINADASYRLAEQKAADYFKSLSEQLVQKMVVPVLIKDIQSWKQNHMHPFLAIYFFARKGKNWFGGLSHLYRLAELHW